MKLHLIQNILFISTCLFLDLRQKYHTKIFFFFPSSQPIFQMGKFFTGRIGQNPPSLLQMRHTTAQKQWLALAAF